MAAQTIHVEGKPYVVVPKQEYDRLTRIAKLPPLPEPDENGHYPAVEYARASLARKIILDRESLGMTQAELAQRAGIRAETLCRIESGKATPSVGTITKIDRALRRVETQRKRRKR